MGQPYIILEIDASELQAQIERLRSVMKPETFIRVMYSIFQRTGGHVRKILREDLPPNYHVKASQINAAVGNAKVTMSGLGVGCSIPIVDRRGSIGGRYRASGGAHGWNAKRRKYKVKTHVVTANTSILPDSMASYGGQPPFRNLGSRLGGLTFTRAGTERFPILKVSGIAIPQMPTNRSREEVQQDIIDYLATRIEHEFQRVIAG